MNKIACLFSGSGAQYPGMMKELYDEVPECRQLFEIANDYYGFDFSHIVFHGTQEDLNRTDIMLPAVFVADMVAYTACQSIHILPSYMAGFSLGEWAAITAAGVISFKEALRIVRIRSEAMAAATPSSGAGMAVILGQPDQVVEELCRRVEFGVVYPANYNYEGQVTVSGTVDGLDELQRIAEKEGILYKRLNVNVPSHCVFMEPAMRCLNDAVKSVDFAAPTCPIIPNATAMPTSSPAEIKENIVRQLVSPVYFGKTIEHLIREGVDCFIEFGPGRTLSGFVRKIAKKHEVNPSIMHVENMDTLFEVQSFFEKENRRND